MRPRAGSGSERAVLVTVALACMLVPLNSTMIAVALPRLAADLHAGVAGAGWLVTGYLVAMASLQPVAGTLGDRLGRRPLILAGLAWFALASVGAAASDALVPLAAFRVQQAVAGALVLPNAIALLRAAVPGERLGRAMGAVGAAMPLAAAVGPPLGGALTALGGWRAIFLVNLPVAGAALAMGAVVLPRGRGERRARASSSAARPTRLFAHLPFAAASGAVALSNLAMYVLLIALPVLLARRGGWSEAEAGLLLAALSLATFALSPVGGRLADRRGRAVPAVAGLALMAAALVPLAAAPTALTVAGLLACVLAAGAGLGLAQAALQVAAVASVGESSAGAASGLFSTSRYAGSIVGTALLAGPLAPHGTAGFGTLFAVTTVAAAGAAALALLLDGHRPRLRFVTAV